MPRLIAGLRSKLAYRIRKRLGFPLGELVLSRLKAAGLAPKLILDVGASYGLFADDALRAWPQAQVHCFEPDLEYVRILEQRAAQDPRLHVCQALVGALAGASQRYHFHLGASSILAGSDTVDDTALDHCRSERVITLDGYCAEFGLQPDFLKIDVQGYELEVLKGAERALESVDVVFTEVNHIEIYRNAPLAADLIGWLAGRGYALHDICNFVPRSDGALWQTDMVFVRHNSPIRASRKW